MGAHQRLEAASETMLDELAAVPELRPVELGEGRRFALHDLALTAEGAFGELIHPDALTPRTENALRRRLGPHGFDAGSEFRHRFWIASEGRDIGTIAVDDYPRGFGEASISSPYIAPRARGRGYAARALNHVQRAATAAGLRGVRLETHWTWRQPLGFYLRRGFWVTGWKDAISLYRTDRLPQHEIRAAGEDALELVVTDEGRSEVILAAVRAGEWLRLDQGPGHARWCDEGPVPRWYATGTLAVHAALRGFPIVRDAAHWADANRWSDAGEPEGLAARIRAWEAQAGRDGWRIPDPRLQLPAPLSRGDSQL